MAHIILLFLIAAEYADLADISAQKAVEDGVAEAAGAAGDEEGVVGEHVSILLMVELVGFVDKSKTITLKRIQYSHSDGRSVPETAQCIHTPAKQGLSYPGPDTSISLPPTPERITIDEALISSCMADFKKQLLRRQ